MKKIFLILLITFSFLSIKGYTQITLSLEANLSEGRGLNTYNKIDVISNVPDSNVLGFTPSNNVNDREIVKSDKSITPWLQDFVDKQFNSNPDAKANRLLWVIQDLSIGKDSTQKHAYSFVKIKVDIYTGITLNYQLVNTFDSTWISNSDVDFGKMIATAFIELYKNSLEQRKSLANIRFQQMAKAGTATKDEIIKKVKLANNYPILNSMYVHGIYKSFSEFKNNTPSTKHFYADVNPQNNKVELFEIAADSSSKLIQNPWGLAINNELYYYSSDQLYPIERSGNTFYLAKYLEPKTRKNQAMYWRGYIGSKQSDNNPYNDAHVLRRAVSTVKGLSLEATHMDFDLAEFTY